MNNFINKFKVNRKHIKKESGIILALDMLDEEGAIELIKSIKEDLDAIKIGYPIVLKNGINVVKKIKKVFDKPVIADFKIADVPHISKIITRIAVNGGCDGVIVHGFVGPDSIEACIIEAKENMVFVATELTSLGGKYFTQPVANDLATMAKEIGAYGIQVPGNRPERIKKIRQLVGNELTIISCGIGAQGGKFGSAIKAGADFEIIGRAIYDSENPEIKIKEIKADTTKAML